MKDHRVKECVWYEDTTRKGIQVGRKGIQVGRKGIQVGRKGIQVGRTGREAPVVCVWYEDTTRKGHPKPDRHPTTTPAKILIRIAPKARDLNLGAKRLQL